MKRLLILAVIAALPAGAAAQPTAPSVYQAEAIDQQGPLDGEEYEADAGAAQAEAAEQAGGAAPGLSPNATRQVEEIVVQARRRDELLEDTPVAVTALGQVELREHGVQRIDNIQQLVPNMTFEGAISGQQANVRIRGVGTSAPAIAFDPGVGMYIDGVYVPRTFGALIDIVDVQQIEVLRGPQGTLFGKNTVGGAINVRTVKPHEDLEGFAMVRPANFGSVDTRAMLNLPLVEDFLYSRFAVASVNSQGYYYNTFADTYTNDPANLSFLGSLRFLPTDDLTVDVFGSWSRTRNHARGPQCVVVNDQPALAALLPDGFFDSCKSSGPFEGEMNTIGQADVESYGVWGIAEYHIGDVGPLEELSLRGLMSWRKQNPRLRTDIDGTRFLAIQNSSMGGDDPTDGLPGVQEQYNPELLLNGSAWDSRVAYVVGGFGFFETGFDGRTQTVLPDSLDRVTLSETNIDNWTWAVFGQATVDVTDWASLTGGVRYTQDKKGLTFAQSDPRTGEPIDNPLSGRKVFEAWTPMGSLALTMPEDWMGDAPIDHVMSYFTYSQGFKGGGFNGVSQPRGVDASQFAFDPETLDNFELGFKTIGFDQMVTLNIALFYGIYDDIQETSVKDLGLDENGDPIIQRLTLNASKATTKGFEIELLTRPMEGLVVQGNVGYTDATYDSFGSADCASDTPPPDCAISDLDGQPIDRSGQSLRGTPMLQTFLSIQYSMPVSPGGGDWLDGWITPRLEWAYQSKVMWLGPEVPQATQRGWNALNARLSYDFLDDRAQVALWARNLLDEAYFDLVTPIISTFGVATRYNQPPPNLRRRAVVSLLRTRGRTKVRPRPHGDEGARTSRADYAARSLELASMRIGSRSST